MNNRQTNRRRGRGNNNNNNRQQQGRGGFDYQNRVDNRARGNAAQMLEKYKKLANDAQMNGDRVQAEYYHQFADHYFRVLADFKARQEEQQAARQARWQDRRDSDDRYQDRDNEGDSDVEALYARAAAESEDSDDDAGQDDPRADRDGDQELMNEREQGASREQGARRAPRRSPQRADEGGNDRGERAPRGRRPVRAPHNEEGDNRAIDIAVLPPAIGLVEDAPTADDAESKPARRPRTRRPRSESDAAADAAE